MPSHYYVECIREAAGVCEKTRKGCCCVIGVTTMVSTCNSQIYFFKNKKRMLLCVRNRRLRCDGCDDVLRMCASKVLRTAAFHSECSSKVLRTVTLLIVSIHYERRLYGVRLRNTCGKHASIYLGTETREFLFKYCLDPPLTRFLKSTPYRAFL